MKTTLLLAASALALAVAGCARTAPPLSARLDCPEKQGDLTRVSAAADGQACVYRERGGAEVSLTRMPLTGDVNATLAILETELKALGGTATSVKQAPVEAAPAGAADEAAKVEAEARADAKVETAELGAFNGKFQAKVEDDGKGGEHARVDLPGLHIATEGDKADVRIGPIHVDADGENETATVKVFRQVRLRGEAMSREKRGVRATFIYAGEALSGGYDFLGYEAAGPRKGPLTVAVVKAKEVGGRDEGDMYSDVKKLVRRNGGV